MDEKKSRVSITSDDQMSWVSITSDDFEQMEKRMGDPLVPSPDLDRNVRVDDSVSHAARLQYAKDEKKRRNERRRQRKARKAGRKRGR